MLRFCIYIEHKFFNRLRSELDNIEYQYSSSPYSLAVSKTLFMGVSYTGIATKADESTVLSSLIYTYQKWNHNFKVYYDSEQYFDILINRKPSDNVIDIY